MTKTITISKWFIWYTNLKEIFTYFVFSGIIVESEGLNILSLSVSINVFGPVSIQQDTIKDPHFCLCKKKIEKAVWEIPAIDVPQFFSTPSTAAAIALPFSTDLSIRAIASYKHFAISKSAITSPFSTTGKCLNFPARTTCSVFKISWKRAIKENVLFFKHYNKPCTIFWRASTAIVSDKTKTGFLVITLDTGVSSRLSSLAITLVAIS